MVRLPDSVPQPYGHPAHLRGHWAFKGCYPVHRICPTTVSRPITAYHVLGTLMFLARSRLALSARHSTLCPLNRRCCLCFGALTKHKIWHPVRHSADLVSGWMSTLTISDHLHHTALPLAITREARASTYFSPHRTFHPRLPQRWVEMHSVNSHVDTVAAIAVYIDPS